MVTDARIRVLLAFDHANLAEELLRQLPDWLGSDALDLIGMYIEDEDLLRASELPGLQEISLTGQVLTLNANRIREQVRREAAQIRSAFEMLARRLRMQHRFITVSGRTSDALCRAAEQADFVLVTRSLRTSGLRPRSGRHFAALARLPHQTLFINEPWESGSTVVVLDGAPEVLRIARRFAAAQGLRLVIVAPAESAAVPADADVVRVPAARWNEDGIADVCLAVDARLLVLPPRDDLDSAELLVRLMDRLPCSLLQVR